MAESSLIYLRDGASGAAVQADLIDEVGNAQLADWNRLWLPFLRERLDALEAEGGLRPDWIHSAHWNWRAKVERVEGLLAYKSFCVVAGGVTQGLAQFDLTQRAREPSQARKPLVYVNYLETAPWNRVDLGCSPPRYRTVGSALITAAVELSVREEFKGAVGLHSLPEADEFYVRMDFINLGADPAYEGLTYFELTPERARAFLE